MTRITVLKPHVANQIAAGEVVERPASIVKELVENSIDALATSITVEIKNGGIDLIRVADNGQGIPAADCMLAFERHATSKIVQAEDLSHIETLGFRGEALASIAAVAQVRLTTRAAGEEAGTHVLIEGGVCRTHEPYGCPEGTTLQIEQVFFNVPARRKFLKAARTEASYIADYLSRMMLARPDISMKYINNGSVIYHSPGDGVLRHAVYCVYGSDILPHLKELDFDDGYLKLTGFVGTAQIARPNRKEQSFLINGRFIRSGLLASALQRAFGTQLMSGRFPFAVIALKIACSEVDVNVHPNKLEVRFVNETRVANSLIQEVERALGAGTVPAMQWPRKEAPCKPDTTASIGQSPETREPVVQAEPKRETPSARPIDLTIPPSGIGRLHEREGDIAAAPWEKVDQPTSPTITDEGAAHKTIPAYRIVSAKTVRETADDEKRPQPEQEAFGIAPYAIAGQVFDTYWIVQMGERIFFIDQHAAHERILYGKFMAQAPETASQRMLMPAILKLTPLELDAWEQSLETLRALGFETAAFGAMTIRVDALPSVLIGKPVETLLRDALAQLGKQGKAATNELRRNAIIQASCKHAIKGGDALTKEQIKELLTAFEQDGMPLTCPHGRPVMIQMSKRELEKQFKRII